MEINLVDMDLALLYYKMTKSTEFKINQSTVQDVFMHLQSADSDFTPPLSQHIDLKKYSQKIVSHAHRFEAWIDERLIGLIAIYDGDPAYITNVSVLTDWQKSGIGSRLLHECIDFLKQKEILAVDLEVSKSNSSAISLYEKNLFHEKSSTERTMIMRLNIGENQ